MSLLKLNPHETKIVPLAGYPIGAVAAPLLYNSLFDFYGLNAICLPMEITKEQLPQFVAAAKLLKFPGCILTMPHKQDVIPLLDEVDATSADFRSVNAIRIRDGKTSGKGLDGKGVVGAFEARGASMKGKEVLMLGAGGISGVLAADLAAKGIKKLTILNRTAEKAKWVAETLKAKTGVETAYGEFSVAAAAKAAETAGVLLQATCLGLKVYDQDYEDLSFIDALPSDAWILEAVSNPPETKLVRHAKARGLNVVLGLDMMVYQMEEMMKFLMDFEITDEGKAIARQFFCDRFGYKG